MQTPLASTDIWLLLAISVGGIDGEASYRDIIAAGDAINHAIFTHEELEGGLCRLHDRNLILKTENGFATTDKANTEIERAKSKAKGWLSTWDILKDSFEIEEISNRTDRYSFPGYSVEIVESAIAQYHADMHELIIKSLQQEQGLSREEAEKQIRGAKKWHQRLWEKFQST